MSDRGVIPTTSLRTQSQAQRPPSPADRDLLSSNTASGWPIAAAVPSNSKKLKLFDFMSTQPQHTEAPKNEQVDVSRDLSVSPFDELQCSRTRCIQCSFIYH